MSFKRVLVLIIAFGFTVSVAAQAVTLHEHDADVWLRAQTIRGSVSFTDGSGVDSGVLHVGDTEYAFEVADGTFEESVELDAGTSAIVACVGETCSDTLRRTLMLDRRPEVYAYAEVSGRDVELHADILESPNGPIASYSWSADESNPSSLAVSGSSDSVGRVDIPEGVPHGEYYFDLHVTDGDDKSGRARTLVTVDADGVRAFDIREDRAAWIDRAIVYEVTPYIFERNGGWTDVTQRLDEIARLGVNTLWIQPVFEAQREGPSTSGQGYGITNYFKLRSDLGTEEDLRELVRTAKEEYGMRVLFDFVPSHTSIEHPYAQQVLEYGTESHYHGFYMTEPDDAPYSQHYHTDREPFVYYFWDDLVIINWDSPEVYRWMMEAGRNWIEDFDIDGYRVDAVWGVNARSPDAMQRWRFDLKRLKPEIFLLGESPAARSLNFEARFDAAYDWYAELDWVSHWTWQTDFDPDESHTIFNNSNESSRSTLLRTALTNEGRGFHPDAKVFRFMENNDTERFLAWHTLEQTKMAATLLFSLPGVPLIYNGQEIGSRSHPYETSAIFAQGRSIRSLDPYGLYDHYQYLTALRSTFPALYSEAMDEVPVSPEAAENRVFAYRRSHEGVHIIGVVNMADEDMQAVLRLPIVRMRLDPSETYFVTDLMTGSESTVPGADLQTMSRAVPGYTTQLFAISNDELSLPVATERSDEVPDRITLAPNYPNPFNPSTTLSFHLPSTGHVTLRVFDVLGRQVATLADGVLEAGRHQVRFDGSGLASGLYLYRLETADARSASRHMILAK